MGGEEEEGGDYSRLFSTQIPPPDDLICFLWEIIHFPETLLDISTAIFLLLLLLFLLIYSFFRTSFQGLSDPHRVALVIFWVSGEKKRKKNQTGKKSNLEDYFILRMKGGGGGGGRRKEGRDDMVRDFSTIPWNDFAILGGEGFFEDSSKMVR